MSIQEQSLVAKEPTAVLTEWEEIKTDPQGLLTRVKRMLINGKNLTIQEATALVDFSITNDLNPLIGEAYCIPGVGCTPGDAGWKRKASEQLWMELREVGKSDGYYHIDYYHATHDEAFYSEEKGDIAWKAVLYDSLSRARWMFEVNQCADQLMKSFPKVGFFDIMKMAKEMAGNPPEWWAVGVVSGEETFSGWKDYNDKTKGRKPEMWDRNERAKKRARKQVLRSRFPNVRLPSMRFGNGGELDLLLEAGDDEPQISVSRVADSGHSTDDIVGMFMGDAPPVKVKEEKLTDIEIARGYETLKGTKFENLNIDQLTLIIENDKTSLKFKAAAELVKEEKMSLEFADVIPQTEDEVTE